MNREEKIENGLFYHVYNRGNDKDRIFGDDSDYFAFIEKMKLLAQKYFVDVLVYTLMPNHYHLLVVQNTEGCISDMMGSLATSAAKRYNLKYGHIGHLFQGPFRYKSVPEDDVQDVACYIHLNPVRGKLAQEPEEWKYSNFVEYLDKRFPLSKDKLSRRESLSAGYVEFVRQVLKDERSEKEYWGKIKSHTEGFLS
jgi:REP element-mobilizing transposase RayT